MRYIRLMAAVALAAVIVAPLTAAAPVKLPRPVSVKPAKPPAPPNPPTPEPPKPSKPVVKDGLSICVKAAKAVFARKEPIALKVTFKNVSAKPIALAGTTFVGWRPTLGYTLVVKEVKSGELWRLREGTNPMIRAPVRLESKLIAPGKSLSARAFINRWAWFPDAAVVAKGGRVRRETLGANLLPPGEYQVTVRCEFGKGFGKGKGKDVKFWIGRIEANPAGFKIDVKEAAKADTGGKWLKLFADAPWYKRRKGTETQFMGTLQTVPRAGGASTLMRTSYYRLGRRTIYTGAKKHPVLDGLVGKGVNIRGKSVQMNLEGRELSEIWPGYIRRIGPIVSPPVVPKVSPPIRRLKILPVRPAPVELR